MQARIHATFGTLGVAGGAPPWSLAATHPGPPPADHTADFSEESEEEGEAEEAEEWARVCEGEEALPSSAFCRALDREAEYDATDHLAAGEGDETRPPLSTPLLEEEDEQRNETHPPLPDEDEQHGGHAPRRRGYDVYVLDEELSIPGKRHREEEDDDEEEGAPEERAEEKRRRKEG